MDDTNHITQELKQEPENDIYDIGTRHLNDEQIQHLIYILNPVLNGPLDYELIKDASINVAQQLKKEDINYESSLTLFGHLQINIEYLREGYLNKEEIKLPLHELLTTHPSGSTLDKESAKKISKELKETIKRPRHEGMIVGAVGSTRLIVMDPRTRTVNEEHIKEVNGRDYSTSDTIIKAYPEDLIVYDNPIAQETRQFQCNWKSTVSNRILKTGPASASEIADEMSASGYIINERRGKDTVKIVFNTLIENSLATMKSEVETPGFYYNDTDGQIKIIKYELPNEIEKEDLIQGIETLEEFAGWFETQIDVLATVFKWGLISPFIFAIKQIGGWVRWMYLYGNGGTGKTTLGEMVLYLWGEPDNESNNIGGSNFDTEARIGNRLKQFTFPLLVNEPGGLFERKGPSELIKTAIEQITSRGKYMGKHYKTIPALAPVCFTANQKFPDDDAFDRRLWGCLFTRGERKSDEEKARFNETFQINNKKQCRLHDLKAIAQYISVEILSDPGLLEKDWQETINMLLVRMYVDVNKKPPEWLLKWSKIETIEDLDELHRERIRIFLQEKINDAFGRLQLLDEDMHPVRDAFENSVDVKGTDDFKSRVWAVLNNRRIPWLFLNKNDDVIITAGFIDEMKGKTCVKDSLQGIADLLGWKKSNSRVREMGFAGKHIKVSRKKFTGFVFPGCEEFDGSCDEM